MHHNSEWSQAFHFNLRPNSALELFEMLHYHTVCHTSHQKLLRKKDLNMCPTPFIVKNAVFGIDCADSDSNAIDNCSSATQRQTQEHCGYANLAVLKVIVVLTFAPLSGFWVCLSWVFMFICYRVCCLMEIVTRKPEHPFWNPVKDTLFAAYNPCSTEPLYRLQRLGFCVAIH